MGQPKQPQYHHIHATEKLPRACSRDDRIVIRGYAVEYFGGRGLPRCWLFFADLEPAVAFSYAVHMSLDVSSHALYPAALETRDATARDTAHNGTCVYTLYVEPRARRPREYAADSVVLQRWLGGTESESNRYLPRNRR